MLLGAPYIAENTVNKRVFIVDDFFFHCFVLIVVYVLAGNEPSPLGSVESYNPVKRRWEYVAAMPTARCSSALLQTTSMLFVIGGVAQGPSNAVEALCLQETV